MPKGTSPFNITTEAARLLSKATADAGERTFSPLYILSATLFFAAIDFFLFLLLRSSILPRETPWDARVKIREALVSTVHNVMTVPLVFWMLAQLDHTELGPGGALGVGPLAHLPMFAIDVAASVFAGFLLWDSAHYLAHPTTYAKALGEMVLHHSAFLAMLYLNRNSLWCNFAFPLLYVGEWSTLFLNGRIICRVLHVKELAFSAGFALLFLLTRVVAFGLLVLQVRPSIVHPFARQSVRS